MDLWKLTIGILVLNWLVACQHLNDKAGQKKAKPNGRIITDLKAQDSLFRNLQQLTQHEISQTSEHDSLAFLLLPMQASCPSCRRKTIDSIVKYKSRLDGQHFIIIAGNGSRSINGYFREQSYTMPLEKQIYYDTTQVAADKNMSSTNPNVYYSVNGKVYRKVSCLPSTIKEDLREFFRHL